MNRSLREVWTHMLGGRISHGARSSEIVRSSYFLGGIGIPLIVLVLVLVSMPGVLKSIVGSFDHTPSGNQTSVASRSDTMLVSAADVERALPESGDTMPPANDVAKGSPISISIVTPISPVETNSESPAANALSGIGNGPMSSGSDSAATMIADTRPTPLSAGSGATPVAASENPPFVQYLADPSQIEGGLWVEVSLTKQTMVLFKGKTPIFRARVSTGQPGFESPTGIFYVQRMLEHDTMNGEFIGEDYDYPDVPNVMYFTDVGHALHGVYWHDDFGTPLSHGCVGMPLEAAEYLFSLAYVGMGLEIFY